VTLFSSALGSSFTPPSRVRRPRGDFYEVILYEANSSRRSTFPASASVMA
jgi:hypothetical protein